MLWRSCLETTEKAVISWVTWPIEAVVGILFSRKWMLFWEGMELRYEAELF